MSNFTKEFQQPFQLYREGGSTYLQVSKYWFETLIVCQKPDLSSISVAFNKFQWMGQESLHQALEGRLLLVHLLCKVRITTYSDCIFNVRKPSKYNELVTRSSDITATYVTINQKESENVHRLARFNCETISYGSLEFV